MCFFPVSYLRVYQISQALVNIQKVILEDVCISLIILIIPSIPPRDTSTLHC